MLQARIVRPQEMMPHFPWFLVIYFHIVYFGNGLPGVETCLSPLPKPLCLYCGHGKSCTDYWQICIDTFAHLLHQVPKAPGQLMHQYLNYNIIIVKMNVKKLLNKIQKGHMATWVTITILYIIKEKTEEKICELFYRKG